MSFFDWKALATLTLGPGLLAAISAAHADPANAPTASDMTETVSKAMEQADAMTAVVSEDAAGTPTRLSQPLTQAIYGRYHAANGEPGHPPAKPCDHPQVTEAGGLCIPPTAHR